MKAAVNNHAEISNAKENTDTQNNGVKYSLKEYTEPVSYTHLDVYKRQPFKTAGNCGV